MSSPLAPSWPPLRAHLGAEFAVGEIAALADWILARTEEGYFGDRDILTVRRFGTLAQTERQLNEWGFSPSDARDERELGAP